MSDVANITDVPEGSVIEAIFAAFMAVFPEEKMKQIDHSEKDGREIFTITSDQKTRTYLRDPKQSFEDLLRTTPHIDVSKIH